MPNYLCKIGGKIETRHFCYVYFEDFVREYFVVNLLFFHKKSITLHNNVYFNLLFHQLPHPKLYSNVKISEIN